MKVLIIDNYDSFTFNLYQLTGEVLYEEFPNEINDIIVKRNDEVSLSEIKKNNFDKIITVSYTHLTLPTILRV